MITVNDKEINKAKGFNKHVVDNTRHKEYLDKLFGKRLVRDNMKRIPSKLHRIGTIDACKKFLWHFDDKRCVPDDGVNSLPYFHGNILNQ